MSEQLTYCEVHPDRETSLRCNKCNRLMCPDCAVSTPVGYRCKQCVRQQDDKFFTAGQNDYVVIAAVCGILSGIATAIIQQIGIPLLFIIFAAIPVGGGIAELALRLTKRRRGRQSAKIAAASVVVGAIIGMLVPTIITYQMFPPLELIWLMFVADFRLILFVGILAYFAYSRFKMRA